MAIEIKFDASGNPEQPTVILAKKNGDKIGILNAVEINVRDSMNDADEISFTVYKYDNGENAHLWDEIKDFRVIYCLEWEKWFELTVELNESDDVKKTITCVELSQAELSQVNLYDIEINTENDIIRDEYDADYPTVLYRDVDSVDGDLKKKYRDSSLLHRIMEKVPHYKVVHVDDTIKNIQRTFEFNDTSLYDAFMDIAEEIHCLFVFGEHEKGGEYDGSIMRTISVYDLESYCNSCNERGEFIEVCSECGSTDIIEGYGEDTTIFVTYDELAEDIQLSTETDEVKNCFKLEAGDGLTTATVRNCNPNGTDYIWYISDDVKEEMSDELVEKIEEYDELYKDIQKNDIEGIKLSDVDKYNSIVRYYNEKYIEKDEDKLSEISIPIGGYSSLINAYYDTMDFELYLESSLMPTGGIADTTAVEQLDILESTLGKYSDDEIPVAVANISSMSLSTANSSVLAMAKAIVDPRYDVEIYEYSKGDVNYPKLSSEFHTYTTDEGVEVKYKIWEGKFKVSHASYDDEDIENMKKELLKDEITPEEREELQKKIDSYEIISSSSVKIEVNGDYETFVRQKIEKALSKSDDENMSITGLFDKDFHIVGEKYDKENPNHIECDIKVGDNKYTVVLDKRYVEIDENGNVVFDENGEPVFKEDECEFCVEIDKYCLNRLISFRDSCQGCIDIMTEQGITGNEGILDEDTSDSDPENNDPTDDDEDTDTVGGSWNKEAICQYLFIPYLYRLKAIEAEIAERENEISIVSDLKKLIEETRNDIQKQLNFEDYLGEELWMEFILYRREDKYSNDNYISDGLNNAQLIAKAYEFFKVAKKEIYKSAELQHTISTTLNNLLVIDKFKPLVEYFKVGNWIRVMVDGVVYRLRLIEYSIDYDDLSNISVEFSDVVRDCSVETKIHNVLDQASSMATSYSSVKRQAEQGNNIVSDIMNNGLDTTNVKIIGGADNQTQTWDKNGMLFREADARSNNYSPTQLKIVNSTIAITDDNWETVKTAIGNFYYTDPITNELKNAYGLNADTIVGRLLIGENLTINNKEGTLSFNENGLSVTGSEDDGIKVVISPNNKSIFTIDNKNGNVFSLDENGNLRIVGDITADNLQFTDNATFDMSKVSTINGLSWKQIPDRPKLHDVAISGLYEDLDGRPDIPEVPDVSDKVEQDDENIVTGGAVYSHVKDYVSDYALKKVQKSNSGKFMYVDDEGNISFIDKDKFKELLGI